jgi:tellurite resistance protein
MTISNYSYSDLQISAWLRALIAISKADQDFSKEEKSLIAAFSADLYLDYERPELIPGFENLQPITALELATQLGDDPQVAEDFLRTAVAIALADGDYSEQEDRIIQQFSNALKREVSVMSEIRIQLNNTTQPNFDFLAPLKEWLEQIQIKDPRLAKLLCKAIPAVCPFERDVFMFGRKLIHIPAMCKINPVYDQLVGLRFRALIYLADVCGEDVTPYCS